MALDGLGLGLTLDTTILEKADKTLENMVRNSSLVMQNLTRGFTAFNEGKVGNLSKTLNDVSVAMDRLSKTEVSPDFDTAGQEKYIDRMQHLLTMVEKMSKIRGAKFYDPTEVYVTDKDASDIIGQMQELQEYKKELAELVNITKNYDSIQQELKKTMYGLRGEIPTLKKEVDGLSTSYEEAKKKQEDALNAMSAQLKRFSTNERKKDASLTDEQVLGMFMKRAQDPTDAMHKYLEAVEKANAEVIKAEEKLASAREQLAGKQSQLKDAGKQYQENWRTKQREEEIRSSYDLIKEEEKILQAEMKYAQSTEAERAAMLTKRNEAEIKADQKRIKDVRKNYEQLRKEIQKGEKDIASLEASRATLKEANQPTKGVDAEIKRRKDELNKLMQEELEFRSSQYWPKLQDIDEKFSNEMFVKNQKALAKQAAEESRKDVSAANKFSRNAQSINEEKEAIKRLTAARDNLSSSTAHYDSVVNSLNKRIAKHEDHVKLLTQEQKESKELQDSVISRYIRERKEIDKLDKSLDELAQKQSSTGVKTADEDNYEKALKDRRARLAKDIQEIETNNAKHIAQLQEKYDASVAEEKIAEIIKQNEREKQEYAKLLDDLYAIEKQKKAMEAEGGGFGDKAYMELIKQETDLTTRKNQLEMQHQNDLDEIRKKHNKKRNDDEVKDFIDAQKEKQKIAEQTAKKMREKSRKYGTISSASADRIIGATDNAKNVNQHKRAIDSLQKARASLNATDKDYLKTVKRLNEAIKYHEIEIELTEEKSKNLMQTHRGLMDIGGQLMRRLALVFSVSQLTQYFRKLVEVRGEFEKQEVALQTLLKSNYRSNILMSQVTDLAVKSPFTLQQLIGYTKQLAAYQIEYKKLFTTTKMLADVSAGLGVEMDRLILAFGQVRAANYLRATEVRQFTEAGFDILGELAKRFSELEGRMVSVADVQERVTRRMVAFSDVEDIFKRVTDAGGIFYNMQAKQAETLAGQWSNLQDKIGLMLNDIGKNNDGLLKGLVRFLSLIVENWEKAANVLTGLVSAFAMVKINAMLTSKEMIKFARSMDVIKGRKKAITVVELFHAGLVKLVRSLKAAGVALKAFVVNNPAIAAILALSSAIGAVWWHLSKQEEAIKNAVKQYSELDKAIQKLSITFNRFSREGNLDKQKDTLKELIEMANNEYQMNINVNLEGLSQEEIEQKFIEAQNEMLRLNSTAAQFSAAYASWQPKRTDKALEGYSSQAREAMEYFLNTGETFIFKIDEMERAGVELSEILVQARKDLEKKPDESLHQYVLRLIEVFTTLHEEYKPLDVSSEDMGMVTEENFGALLAAGMNKATESSRELGLSIYEIKNQLDSFNISYWSAFNKYFGFLNNIELPNILSEDEKERRIKISIDTHAAQNDWDDFMIGLAYDAANKKFNINITPQLDKNADADLENWQKTFNEKFKNFSGFINIGSKSTTQKQQIEALNLELKKQIDLLNRITAAGGAAAVAVGGAYEGLNIEEIKQKIQSLNSMINWLGGSSGGGGNSAMDKVRNRSNVIREMNQEYEKLLKNMTEEEAKLTVINSYRQTLKTLGLEGLGFKIDTMNFDDESTLESLRKLQKNYKAGGKYYNEIQKMIDNIEVTLNVEAKVEKLDKLEKDIADMFDELNLSKDLEKLNVGKGVAKSLFGINTKSTSEIRAWLINRKSDFEKLGTDGVEAYNKALEKLNDMEDKEQVERLKKYLEYTRGAVSERAKIKIEELQKLKEIEETFDKAEKEAKTDAEKKEVNEHRGRAIAGVQKETLDATKKLDWEEFKTSDIFVSLFNDLDNASTELLNHARTKIKEFQDQWKDMPISDAKEMIDKLNQLDLALLNTGNPFADYKTNKKALDEAMEKRDINPRKANSHQELREALDKENVESTKQIEQSTKAIELLELINQKKAEEKDVTLKSLGYEDQYAEKLGLSNEILTNSVENNEDLIREERRKVENAQENIAQNTKLSTQQQDQINKLNEQNEHLGNALNMANDLYDSFKGLAVALGADEDSPAMIFADMGMNMLNTVMNTIMLQIQLNAAAVAAQALGIAMNSAMGIIGWIVTGVQLLTQALTAIFNVAEKKRQEQIDYYLDMAESLKASYEELSEVVDRAFSYSQLDLAIKKMEILNAQMEQALKKAVALQMSDKDKHATDNKKVRQMLEDTSLITEAALLDPDFLASYKEEDRDAIIESLRALKENEEDFENQVNEIMSDLGGIKTEDRLSVAEDFVDAWLEAFKETGNGLSGLDEEFDNFFENLLKKKAAMTIADKAMQDWVSAVNDAISEESEGGYDITSSEQAKIRDAEEDAKKRINSALLNIFDGVDLGGGGSLSALQKGIQGITEDTAQVIESYLNSVRFYVETISRDTSSQLTEVKAMHKLLDSVVMAGHPLGRSGIKVFMD